MRIVRRLCLSSEIQMLSQYNNSKFPQLKNKVKLLTKVNWTLEKQGNTWASDVEAKKLHKAIFEFNPDSQVISEVLGGISQAQRSGIINSYWKLTGRKLSGDLKNALAGDLEKICQKIIAEPKILLAKTLCKALLSFPVDDDFLVSLLCERTPEEVKSVKESYLNKFSRRIEADVEGYRDAGSAEVFSALLNTHRESHTSPLQVHEDAQGLHKFGIGVKFSDDAEPLVMTLLKTRSFDHLRAVFSEYKRLVGSTIDLNVPSSMPASSRNALTSVLSAIASPELHSARVLGKTKPPFYLSTILVFRLTRSREFWRKMENIYISLYNVRIKDELIVHTDGEATALLMNLLEF